MIRAAKTLLASYLRAWAEHLDAQYEWKPPKIYRIENGPDDCRFLAVHDDGVVLFCANSGTLPVESRLMPWTEAAALHSRQEF